MMTLVTCLLSTLVISQSGAPAGADEWGPRAPERTAVNEPTRVPMIPGFRWPVVEVEINGKGPFRMILDTGAGTTVLNEDLVQELGLTSTGKRRIGDPSNPEAHEVDVLSVDSIVIGSARFEVVPAVGWRGPALVSAGGIRGLVGFPTFAECLLTLDYPGARVELAAGTLPEPDGKEVLPMKVTGTPSIPIEIAGTAFEGHLDAGNSSTLVVPAAWKDRMPLVEGSIREGIGERAGLPTEFTAARLDGQLKLGQATIASPEVHFDSTLPLVNVGYEILKDFRITLDQKAGRLQLSRPPVSRPAVTPRRIGVQMAMKNGSVFTAAMVMPGSAGEAAGLLAGDAVLEVDGQAMSQDVMLAALRGSAPIVLTIEREGERRTVTLFAQSAEYPEVLAAKALLSADGTWRFDVTLSSPYDTPERYADAWRVLDGEGVQLGVRVLTHDHAAEQPFTRSLTGVEIPESVGKVVIQGRDKKNGWGGATVEVALGRH